MRAHRLFRIVIMCITASLISSTLHAAPNAKLWPKWQTHNANNTATIDHSAWGQFLTQYTQPVAGVVRVQYSNVSTADKQLLTAYLEQLSKTRISSFNRPEQRAFWINTYNALTVKTVIDAYPVASIKDIKFGKLFGSGPWDKKLMTVEGTALSLNDIEHRILRPIWKDPRTHYAVNCASIGCPNLQTTPFSAQNTEQLLNKAAKNYINSPRGVTVGKKLVVSAIYKWFREDFGNNEQAIIQHLRQYAAPTLKQSLNGVTKIDRYQYDWSLNVAQ